MKNADMPAMPCEWKDFDSQGVQVVRESYEGLTKREMFAMHICSSLIGKANSEYEFSGVAEDAVYLADVLLAELEKTND